MSQSRNQNPRSKRLAEQIFREIRSQITFFSRNSTIKNTSIERVSVNRDLSLATLYVRFNTFNHSSAYTPSELSAEEIASNLKELNQNSGYFRSVLAKSLSIYKVPQIRFIYDDSFEEKKRIDDLFNQLNEKI